VWAGLASNTSKGRNIEFVERRSRILQGRSFCGLVEIVA
jgi:hypothetical protein